MTTIKNLESIAALEILLDSRSTLWPEMLTPKWFLKCHSWRLFCWKMIEFQEKIQFVQKE
jgi:hypothetical protein